MLENQQTNLNGFSAPTPLVLENCTTRILELENTRILEWFESMIVCFFHFFELNIFVEIIFNEIFLLYFSYYPHDQILTSPLPPVIILSESFIYFF